MTEEIKENKTETALLEKNFDVFCARMQKAVKKILGNEQHVVLQNVKKNNGVYYKALTVMDTDGKRNIAPTMYLQYYFRKYEGGMEFSDVVEEFLLDYQKSKPRECIRYDSELFTIWENAKKRIVCRLVNYKMNEELLESVPHVRFLDLAITFSYLLDNKNGCDMGIILICNEHLKLWDVTSDELYRCAYVNTPRLLPYSLMNMNDILGGFLKDLTEGVVIDKFEADLGEKMKEIEDTFEFLYVLSNQKKIQGAGVMLYENTLKEVAEKLQADLYILPSSIHEVILIPQTEEISGQELSLMVQEVNRTQLEKEEILSDHVYYFSRETGQITM